jgi:hypothetical protein
MIRNTDAHNGSRTGKTHIHTKTISCQSSSTVFDPPENLLHLIPVCLLRVEAEAFARLGTIRATCTIEKLIYFLR